MTTMSVEQAETLYTILDKHVGMFSFEGVLQEEETGVRQPVLSSRNP